MFHYDVTNDLVNIDVPTLIVGANKDRLTQPDASTFMKERMPNAELVMLSPANHQGLVERHNEVNKAVEQFIKKLEREPAGKV